MILHINLFLSYYVRTACDLNQEYFEALKYVMDVASKNIIKHNQNLLSTEETSILDSQMCLQAAMPFGFSRLHICEIYEKKKGELFIQSKWKPSEINKYGPLSTVFYYQTLIDYLPKNIKVY